MNGRIKELGVEANVLNYFTGGDTPRQYFIEDEVTVKDITEFAKLIIKECSQVAMDNLACPASAIEAHFGVE